MKKKILHIQTIRNVLAISFLLLFILSLTNNFYKIPIFNFQFFSTLERILIDFSYIALGTFLTLLLLTFLFGRIYCSFLCPLGLLQEIIFYLAKPFCKFNKTFEKNKIYKYLIASVFYGALFGSSVFLAKYLEPYTIFVSASSLTKTSLIIVSAIILLVILRSRFFCTNICPVGTVLGLISRYSIFKINIDKSKCVKCGMCVKNCQSNSIDIENGIVQNETCVKCFKCVGTCKLNAINYKKDNIKKDTQKEKLFDITKRRFIFDAICLGTFFVTFKRISYKVKNEIGRIKNIILPPGARSNKEFVSNCLNCNLCTKNCPQNIIKPKDETFGAVHLDLSENFCKFDCNICSHVCPTGALKRLTLKEKQNTKIGKAFINTSECIQCGLCVETCPKNAITKLDGEAPTVDGNKCIGCGKCALECPVKTIFINGIEEQETDLKN